MTAQRGRQVAESGHGSLLTRPSVRLGHHPARNDSGPRLFWLKQETQLNTAKLAGGLKVKSPEAESASKRKCV